MVNILIYIQAISDMKTISKGNPLAQAKNVALHFPSRRKCSSAQTMS